MESPVSKTRSFGQKDLGFGDARHFRQKGKQINIKTGDQKKISTLKTVHVTMKIH